VILFRVEETNEAYSRTLEASDCGDDDDE
jgi:hypothetical protein